MKKILLACFALSFLAALLERVELIGPAKAQSSGRVSTVTAPTPTPELPPSLFQSKKHILDRGDFKVGFSPRYIAMRGVGHKRRHIQPMAKDLRPVFKEIADTFNRLLALPTNVYISMGYCDTPNAFYLPKAHQIVICYELYDIFNEEFKQRTESQKEANEMVGSSLYHTLFHELGHCLIDVLRLPATGREEDAVDQLATILMMDDSAASHYRAGWAAYWYSLASAYDDLNNMPFWDEHSFNETRYVDQLCLIYGSDPDHNGRLVGENILPEKRAEKCEREYKNAERAWLTLLAPYIKKKK